MSIVSLMPDAPPAGHVKLARKAFDADHGDPWWLEPRVFSRWEAWVDVIQMACFSAYKYVTKLCVLTLERGEFVASRRYLASRWKWTEKRVRHWLQSAEKGARLRAQRETPVGTVYLIVNYDTYQGGVSSEGPAKGPPKGQAGAQERSSKNLKAVKALSISGADSASLFSPDSTTTEPPSPVATVLARFVALHPLRRVGDKHAAIVAKALGFGYSPDELCTAIEANASDPWHRQRHKHELSYVLRDVEHIDGFLANAEAPQPIVDEHGVLTAYGERITRPSR